MAKVILLTPNDKEVYKFSKFHAKRFPLGIGYLATALEKVGHEVSIIDGSLDNLSNSDISNMVITAKPDFVGVSCTTPLYHDAISIIKDIKDNLPSAVIIFGGPHVSALPEATMQTSMADFICIGEGEENVTAIIDAVERNGDFGVIPSIAYRWRGREGTTESYRLRFRQDRTKTYKAIDLNKFPIPARHLFDYKRYGDLGRGVIEPQTGAMFSRGCPGRSYDDKTEILTENGWKLFKDLVDNEKVGVYHPENDNVIFEVPKGRLSYHYRGYMIHMKNKQIDLMVTSNHVNYCNTVDGAYKGRPYRFEDALNFLKLHKTQRRSFLRGCNGHVDNRTTVTIGSRVFDAKLFFKFLGYYLSEGIVLPKNGGIWLYQNANSKCFHDMFETCKLLGFGVFVIDRSNEHNDQKRAIVFKCKVLADYLRPLGRSWEKHIPRELLSYNKECLQIFLDAYVEGDGYIKKYRTRPNNKPTKSITTTSKKMADDIQYITFLLGKAANICTEERPAPRVIAGRLITNLRPKYSIDVPITSSHTFIQGSQIKKVRYDAMAYCVEVSTGIIVARRNNRVIINGNCAFCGAAGTLVRWRNLDNVFDELSLVQNMGIPNVFVMDDTYTNNRKRILELSRGIVDRGISLTISVQLRLDQIDKEVCDAMYASGVRYVGPGIESGNEDIIKAIGKGPKESKEHIRSKMRLLKEYDWTIRCSYVLGMVGETEAQMMETIEFAKELDADENAFSVLVPYPDSPLWAVAKANGDVHDTMDFRKFLYYQDVGCNLSTVPSKKLSALREYAYEYVGNKAYKVAEISQ